MIRGEMSHVNKPLLYMRSKVSLVCMHHPFRFTTQVFSSYSRPFSSRNVQLCTSSSLSEVKVTRSESSKRP